jgi:putative transcriptional regulator
MKDNQFAELLESVREAGHIQQGRQQPSRKFSFSPFDIKGIRKKLKVSQDTFAHLIGVSISTLRNWEQGRRTPDGPARALLTVASKNPQAVWKALNS